MNTNNLINETSEGYLNVGALQYLTAAKLSNNYYYVFTKESEQQILISKFLSKCEGLIDFCLYRLKKNIFYDRHDVVNFLLGSRVGNPLKRSISHLFTFYKKELSPNSYQIYQAKLLNVDLCGHLVCFLDVDTNFSHPLALTRDNYNIILRQSTEKLITFLSLNEFIKSPNQIIQGDTDDIVKQLDYLTTLRPLFDYSWNNKPYSSNPADHQPRIIKWLTPAEQNKETIDAIRNEYILSRI